MGYGKNRQWWGVLYPENMRHDWTSLLETEVQLPYAYCIHDKGLELEDGSERKTHVHLILVWPSPTTHKHACEVFDRLSAPGRRCFADIKPVYSAENAYKYLIHDTEDSKKRGKYQFDPKERITGNNYDIGAYCQIGVEEKNEMFDLLTDMCLKLKVINYADFVEAAKDNYFDRYDVVREVIKGNRGHFEALTRGIFLRGQDPDTELRRASNRMNMKRNLQKGAAAPGDHQADPDAAAPEIEGGLAK